MKLRNKLVAVMAASMVVTSVPVITMADSTNTLSIYNYSIKDSTVGFTTTSKVYRTSDAATQMYTSETGTGYEFSYTNVPGLEIKPTATRNLSGVESAFVSLTTDSSFQQDAYIFLADALAGNGTTKMYFDKDEKAVNANTAAWNGEKKSDIIKNFLTDSSTGRVTFTINYDINGNIVTSGAAGVATAKVSVSDLTEFEQNERKYKSTLRIDLTGAFDQRNTYKVPFLCKVGGDKEVLAYLDGRDSFVSTTTFALSGKLSDKKLTATAGSNTITVDNVEKIGEIRLAENQMKSLANAENRWVKIELPSSSNLEFDLSATKKTIVFEGRRGFNGKKTEASSIDVKYGTSTRTRYNDTVDDTQILLVQLPAWEDTAKGEVVIKDIQVAPKDKTAATGDVFVTVNEDLTRGRVDSTKSFASTKLLDSTSLKVATVADYGITLESTPIDVKAGRSGILANKKATFVLKESVKDSLVDTRKIEFTLENGYIFGPADVKSVSQSYSSTSYMQAAKERFIQLIDDETIKFEEKAGKDGSNEGFVRSSLALDIDANGYVVGFSGKYDRLKNDSDDKVKVTLPVAAPVMAKGEIKVKAGNLFTRSYEKDVEAVIAKIIEPIKVEVESAKLKVGLQDQTAGKVTIKETDKGMFQRGWLYLSAENFENLGITFDQVPDIKVTSGNMEIKNVQITKNKKLVAIEVSKTSTEASAIEISNIKFTADRTVPEANYDLQIWGDALTDENVLDVASYSLNAGVMTTARGQYTDMYTVPDFIAMTTKNTQDIDASGLKAATASFVIGANKFTVNGESVDMDSAAYIKDNYTMVPVKYVAKAFGIEGNQVQYDQKSSTATIVAGNKVVSITAGKAFITVNGTVVPMATKAEVNKDNRMCVPMAYIASALDVQKTWDASTKTATFTNQTQAE